MYAVYKYQIALTDEPMTPEELKACRERAEKRAHVAGEDVPRLLATVKHATARAEKAEAALAELRRRMVANAGFGVRMHVARWVHVMHATGHGSTTAEAMCRSAGFDPDEAVGL